MDDYIAEREEKLFSANGLGSFDALWRLKVELVDEPNRDGKAWSSVGILKLEGRKYYLKRQVNYLTSSLIHWKNRPTFQLEFKNIMAFADRNIPALSAVYYAERDDSEGYRAILITRSLDGWAPFSGIAENWKALARETRDAITAVCGEAIRNMHDNGEIHGCCYPKHIFLKEGEGGRWDAAFIDLEKARPLWFGRSDRVKDLETLIRRGRDFLTMEDVRKLLAAYFSDLEDSPKVESYLKQINKRMTKRGLQLK